MLKTSDNIKVTPPIIAIWPSAFMTMLELANLAAPNEVSGLAYVEKKNGLPVITRVIYRGGRDTTGSTNITKEMMSYVWELKQAGKASESKLIHCWFHSHVDMGTFWSGRDEMTIDGEEEGEVCAGWQIALVVNRRQQAKCTVVQYEPFRCRFDDVDLLFYCDDDPMSGKDAVAYARAMWDQSREKEMGIIERLFSKSGEDVPQVPQKMPAVVGVAEKAVRESKDKVTVEPNFWRKQFPWLITLVEFLNKWSREKEEENDPGMLKEISTEWRNEKKEENAPVVSPAKVFSPVKKETVAAVPLVKTEVVEAEKKPDTTICPGGKLPHWEQEKLGEKKSLVREDGEDSKQDQTHVPDFSIAGEKDKPGSKIGENTERTRVIVNPGDVIDHLFAEDAELPVLVLPESGEETGKEEIDADMHEDKGITTETDGSNATDQRKHG